MKIILLRHGKPDIPSLKKITAFNFIQWVEQYNLSGLSQSSSPTIEALKCTEKCNVIICSELKRSKESAKALNEKKIILSSSIFNEASLPIPTWKYIKASPKLWAVLFRILWLFGYSKNSESFKKTKQRALIATKKLIEEAQNHKSVLFVGHGVYNRVIAKELKSMGWVGNKNPGCKHWSFSVYKKEHNNTH